MAEEPTADPKPLPWGDKPTPFPVGTVFTGPDRFSVEVTDVEGQIVYLDGMGLMAKEVQGCLDKEGWQAQPPR